MAKKFDKKDERNNKRNAPRNHKGKSHTTKSKDYNEMGASITNDLAWYAHYPDITYNAGKLSMLYPGGSKYNFLKDGHTAPVTSKVHTVNSVMALEYYPTYGYSHSIRDPLTQMSRSLFNKLVAATNRVPSYEYTDLTMYQIAMTNLVQFYYYAARIYLIAGSYDPYNLAWNQSIFKVLRVDGDDIKRNRSLLYSYLIQFAHRISAFPFPKSFDLFNRTAQLVSNIYTDNEGGKKDQLYIFNPMGTYVWNETLDSGSSLQWMDYRADGDITYDRIVTIGETLINAMQGSSDIQLMTADILKVYSDELVYVNPIPENGRITPVWDAMVLTQIMNARFTGRVVSNLSITQGTDSAALEPYLIAAPTIENVDREFYFDALRPMLNFLVSDPSEGTVVEGSRFQFIVDPVATPDNNDPLVSFGSEVLYQMRMINILENGQFSTYTFGNSVLVDDVNGFRICAALTKFDWHPRIGVFTKDGEFQGDLWDCSNYAFITNDQIKLMNDAALANLMLIFG